MEELVLTSPRSPRSSPPLPLLPFCLRNAAWKGQAFPACNHDNPTRHPTHMTHQVRSPTHIWANTQRQYFLIKTFESITPQVRTLFQLQRLHKLHVLCIKCTSQAKLFSTLFEVSTQPVMTAMQVFPSEQPRETPSSLYRCLHLPYQGLSASPSLLSS